MGQLDASLSVLDVWLILAITLAIVDVKLYGSDDVPIGMATDFHLKAYAIATRMATVVAMVGLVTCWVCNPAQ